MFKGERAEFPPLPLMHIFSNYLIVSLLVLETDVQMHQWSQQRPDFLVQNILQSNDTPKRPKMNLYAYTWYCVCHAQA